LGVWGLRTTVDRVCSDKGEGGLGVTDLMTRNTEHLPPPQIAP
jgi:hypothetical protein